MVTLYGIKNCDTIKKARRWLEANNIDYRFHDYRVDGLDSELLNGFINELGWEALLNTRGTTWRKLDETTRNKITDAASAAALMTEMPYLSPVSSAGFTDSPFPLGHVVRIILSCFPYFAIHRIILNIFTCRRFSNNRKQ